jgi:hypothetical protein
MLADVAERYSVSQEVVLRRFLALGLTNWRFANEKRDEYRRAYECARSRTAPGGPNERPGQIAKLHRLNEFHRDEINSSDISEYLEVKVNRLPRLEEELPRRPLVAAEG